MTLQVESRRYVRRQVYIRAKVVCKNEAPPLDCAIVDISEAGARLNIQTDEEVPQEFILVLGANGRPYRRCRVVWRKNAYVGVVFDRTLSSRFFQHQAEPAAEE